LKASLSFDNAWTWHTLLDTYVTYVTGFMTALGLFQRGFHIGSFGVNIFENIS